MAGAYPDSSGSNLLSIAVLQHEVAEHGRVIETFTIEGVVRAIVREKNMVALEDDSSATLLELPSLDEKLAVGEWLEIQGDHCALTRNRFGIQVGTAPVVDNDGSHSKLGKSGSVFLEAGMNLIRAAWFNGMEDPALDLEYEGPDVPRQAVPASVLWHGPAGEINTSDVRPGIHYAAYEGQDWYALPDFSRLKPVGEGIATNFAVAYGIRNRNCGLTFDGFIQIKHSGVYNFWEPDDSQNVSGAYNDGSNRPNDTEGPSHRHGTGCVLGCIDGHTEFIKFAKALPLLNASTANDFWCYPGAADGHF